MLLKGLLFWQQINFCNQKDFSSTRRERRIPASIPGAHKFNFASSRWVKTLSPVYHRSTFICDASALNTVAWVSEPVHRNTRRRKRVKLRGGKNSECSVRQSNPSRRLVCSRGHQKYCRLKKKQKKKSVLVDAKNNKWSVYENVLWGGCTSANGRQDGAGLQSFTPVLSQIAEKRPFNRILSNSYDPVLGPLGI